MNCLQIHYRQSDNCAVIELTKNYTGKVEWLTDDKSIYLIEYFLNGGFHNINGPARRYINNVCGFKLKNEYWINDVWVCNNNKIYFYNSPEYKQWMLLENMKKIKNI